jgi:nitrile hydratase
MSGSGSGSGSGRGGARFAVGDAVRTREAAREGHTRLPRYLEQRRGHVVAVHGAYPLADERARGISSAPRSLYSVLFDGADVWGDAAQGKTTIVADLWEDYLERP